MSPIVMTSVTLRQHGYTQERAESFFDALRNRLQANPAIDSVSLRVYEGG